MVSSRNRRFGGGGIRRQIRSRRPNLGAELPEVLGAAAWWRTNEGWDGNIWTDKIAGYEADGTGHAPTTTTLNIDHTVLRFNGSSQYLEFGSDVASLFNGSDYTVGIAYRTRRTNTEFLFSCSDGSTTDDFWIYKSSSAVDEVRSRHRKTSVTSGPWSAPGAYGGYGAAIVGYEDAGKTIRNRVNGTESTPTHTQGLAGLDRGAIGCLLNASPSLYGQVDIAEVCIFPRKLTSDEMAQLQEYFDARYDVWRKIEELPNLVAAWDPRRGKTIGTGVSDWDDVVNSYTVSQATGSKQPTQTLVSSAASGCPALSFASASSQLLEGSGLTTIESAANNDNWTMACAFRQSALVASQAMMGVGGSGTTRSAALYVTAAGTAVNETLDPTLRQAAISSLFSPAGVDYYMAGTSELALDGTGNGTPATAAAANLSSIDTFTVGARNYSATEDRYLNGDLYAGLFFDTEMVSTDLDALIKPLLDDLMGL